MTMQVARVRTQGTSKAQRLTVQAMAAEHVERIGARIRERREELELSRRKLAALMAGSVTENDIYRWERGQHRPHDDKLAALAEALQVEVVTFLVDAPEAGTTDLMDSFKPETSASSTTGLLERKVDLMLRGLDVLLESRQGEPEVADLLEDVHAVLDDLDDERPPT